MFRYIRNSLSEEEWNTPPSDIVFLNIKAQAIKIWNTYDDTYGYPQSKIARIEDLPNVGSNCASMVQMFDMDNMNVLYWAVNDESKAWLERLLD